MNYTNSMNLPSALVDAIVNDPYTKGDADISVTQLIGPPKIRVLKTRHRDEITEDVSDMVWAMVGNNTHYIIDRAAHKDSLQEERLSITVNGWKISGQADLYEKGVITDWKVTSVYSCLNGVKPEWLSQCNIYAHLFRESGFKVDKVQIITILRDWSKFGGQRSKNYPSKQVVVHDVPLWSHPVAMNYIRDRVRVHQNAEVLSDDDIPSCTPEERWHKSDAWKVYKGKNKRATRVLETEDAAETLKSAMEEKTGDKYRIEFFEGEDVRCLNYCSVIHHCHYGRSLVPF